jgi:hypothetical protein
MTTTAAAETFIQQIETLCREYPDLVNPSYLGSCLYVKETGGMVSDDDKPNVADHCLIGTFLVENTGIDDETLVTYEDTAAPEVMRELGFDEVLSEIAGIYQSIADREIPWGQVPREARTMVSNFLATRG